MVYWSIPAMAVLAGFAMPAWAAPSELQCVQRFNECANACAALESHANEGCLGRCLLDNGCTIDEDRPPDGSPTGGLPSSSLSKSTLPDDRLPDSRLPESHLPESRMP